MDLSGARLRGLSRTLSLDGRIDLNGVADLSARQRIEAWIDEVAGRLLLASELRADLKGAVFEVRQGYKSKDSKRQQADLSNATNAYVNLYLPVLLLLSTQIDGDVAARYTQARWLLLTGTTDGTSTTSTYVFCRDVVGYDLAGFFERYAPAIKRELEIVLDLLLRPE